MPGTTKIVAWARSTGGPAPEPSAFSSELAPEYFGTALVTHFINRMVSALLNESLLPGGLQRLYLTRRIGGAAFRAVVRREPHPGESLNLLADRPKKGGPAWAAGTPVGLAFAALQAAAAEGGELLSAPARGVVERSIAAWDGTPLPLDAGWAGDVVACLPQAERAAARIALLAGLAPHRITDADVAVWRSGETTDADLVRLLGFGAMAAVRRIEGSICAASGVAH